MRIKSQLWPAAVLVPMALLCGCVTRGVAQTSRDTKFATTPPSPKEVLRLLLSLRDVPLRMHETCATAGTRASDTDLGDYISGWLAELKSTQGANWIKASASPEPLTGDRQPGWRCIVMFRHVAGDDRWGWGVSFLVRASDRRPLQDSIRCLGAG